MNQKTTPPRLDKQETQQKPKRKIKQPIPITPETITIIFGIIIILLSIYFVFRFGATESNLWYNRGVL